MANAHRQEVETTQDMDVWGNGQIYSGILTMTIAVLWFFGGLLMFAALMRGLWKLTPSSNLQPVPRHG